MKISRNGATPAVVLFDIDGTLIRRSGPQHREALVEAVRAVMSLDTTTDHIPVQGMLDRDILAAMLGNAGVSPFQIRRAMPALVRRAQQIYLRISPRSLRDKVCPGVRPVLYRMSRRGIPMGLVTGNLTRIGWRKMELAGLRHYFGFGAFAEQARDRAGLVGIAMRHARGQGWIGAETRVWLVGDHENDVGAARANRVRSLAVATGLTSLDGLSACGPDLLLNDLRSLKMGTLLGG